MAGLWGANVEDLKGLGTTLTQKGEDITNTANQLENQINSVQWQGPDADKFKSGDWPTAKQQLTQAAQTLKDAGQKATKNAQEQQDASGH